MIWVALTIAILSAIGVDPCVRTVPVCIPASQAG